VDFTKGEYNRRVDLAKNGGVSQTEFNESKRKRDAAEKTIAVLTQEINGILIALENNPDIDPKEHPHYRKALAKLHDAELNLERTEVKAPADGIIGTAPHPGDYARAGVPSLNLVGSKDIWIEANYKETELTDVKPGQPVTIEVDTYPGRKWSGRVESISPATGSEFSVLPAQNATGNWVKVVQRIAVRIAVDEKSESFPLRVGMSAHVTIDIGHYPHGLFHTASAQEK
jgi:membrane fusion protein (multidrug efflux system)